MTTAEGPLTEQTQQVSVEEALLEEEDIRPEGAVVGVVVAAEEHER